MAKKHCQSLLVLDKKIIKYYKKNLRFGKAIKKDYEFEMVRQFKQRRTKIE